MARARIILNSTEYAEFNKGWKATDCIYKVSLVDIPTNERVGSSKFRPTDPFIQADKPKPIEG